MNIVEDKDFSLEAEQYFQDKLKPKEKVIKKKRKNDEYNIQCDIVQYLRELKQSNKIVCFYAVINESNYTTSPKAIKQGMIKGVSDLVILLQNHTLYLELKKDRPILKSGKKSKADYQKSEQKYFQAMINKTVNNSYYCSYGYDESKSIIDSIIEKYPIIDYDEHYLM